MKEFCAIPLSPVRLMYVEKMELEKDNAFGGIKNLSELK